MGEWNLYGTDRKNQFEKDLEPAALKSKLLRYQKELGKEFGIVELLALEEVRVKALLAEVINDAPEFLIDQIGKMRKDPANDTITDSLAHIADVLESSLDRICS